MKRQVLFVHGAGEGAHEEDEKLAASLRDALGSEYEVRSPQMPDEDDPELGAWKEKIAGELATMGGAAILVGHSVGALVLLKYLSEEAKEKPAAGLFLVATPYLGTGGWEVEEDALREDFASKLREGLPVFLYHGREDEIVPFEHLALYAGALPRATIREFDGRGHQLDEDLSEVALDIQKLQGGIHGSSTPERRRRLLPNNLPVRGDTVNHIQRQVQEAIDGLVESGIERGLQVSVYRNGEPVVDAVAGVADPETGRPVTPETPIYVYSVGKGATATVAHVLVERGAFGYDTPIVDLWPEFGARGKEAATVRHALTHTVGVPGIPVNTTPEDLCDWDKMCAVIADSEPWWEPGTKTAYHAYTFGYIVGEIVRRAAGKPISQVLREEVAGPLGVANELFFGVPEPELGRLARLEDAEGGAEMLASMPDDSPIFKWGPRETVPTAGFGNRADVLMAEIPAGGKTSARAMARTYAALLGEVDGVRLISPERLREVSAVSFGGTDQIMGNQVSWALGYSVGRIGTEAQKTPTTFGMGGVGGSYAYADTETGISFALTKNRLTMDFSAAEQIAGIVTKAVAGD